MTIANQTLMLDVDGVLIKGRPHDGLPWTTDLEGAFGIKPEQLADCFFRPYWGEIVTGKRDLFDCLALAIPDLPATEFVDFWFRNDALIDTAVLEDCRSLRGNGARVFLCTNQEHHRVRYLLDDLGLREEFSGIFYSAQVGFKKPDPLFFEAIQSAMGQPPSAITLIDDTKENVRSALACGWQAYSWPTSERLVDLVSAS